MNTTTRLFAVLMTMLLGCGDGGGVPGPIGDAGPATTVDVPSTAVISTAGFTINHSMNRLASMRTGRTVAYEQLTLEVASADALIAGGSTALGTTPLDTTACPAMGGCAWSVANIALGGVTLGLAARLRDNRATPLWVTTTTGFASPANLNTAAGTGRFDNGRAFAVTRDAIDGVIAPLVGLSGDEVMARGFVFGLVYDRASDASADGSGAPVMGATVASNSAGLRIVYPNNMFSGTVASTGSQGVFLAIPNAPGAAGPVTFVIAPPGDRTLTWDPHRVAVTAPGVVHFTPMYAL